MRLLDILTLLLKGALLGVLSMGIAQAQTGNYIFNRFANGDDPSVALRSAALVQTFVAPATPCCEWALYTILDNRATGGDNVAIYARADKWSTGHTWAGVFELRDHDGTAGATWVLELDAMAKPGGRAMDYGIGLVVGRDYALVDTRPPDLADAVLDQGFAILPDWIDRGHVSVNYGLLIDVPCNVACIRVPAGGDVQLDGGNDATAQAVVRFDPQTGFVGFWRKRICIVCWNALTGEQKRMWTP